VKELDLGHNEKPDYFNCKGMIVFARKESCLYKACPKPECNKKVTESSGGGEYFCEKCNQNFSEFKYRAILSVCCWSLGRGGESGRGTVDSYEGTGRQTGLVEETYSLCL
jgi:hypothetical protein